MKNKIIILSTISIVVIILIGLSVPFLALSVKTNRIDNDYVYLKEKEEYSIKQEVEGVELVTQHISCGYATIEMLSSFYGDKVSEDDLDSKNKGKISTSSSNGFLKEVNKSIPNKKFKKLSYLKNDELLIEIYKSLSNNNPVAIEWAAKFEGEWTLHFSLITASDIKNGFITIYNPYGYIENITIDDFIERSTFKAYQKMPLFLKFGFAFNAYEKNTLFIVE